MDPSVTDPPATTEPAAQIAHAANPSPSHGPNQNHNHPPYAEMITAAITALKEKKGSSRTAIAKYIDKAYSNLPPSHSALLTHHLKRLKSAGQLVMVKHSYKLSRSPLPTPPGPGDAASSSGPKRGPGRPPKPKLITQPVITNGPGPVANPGPEPVANAGLGPESVFVSLGLVDVPTTGATRGRGRPPKPKTGTVNVGPMTVKRGRGRPPGMKPLSLLTGSGGPKRRPGRPPRSVSGPDGGPKPRGRPKRSAATSSAAKVAGRPRGRPRKSDGGGAGVGVGGGSDGVWPVTVGGGLAKLPVKRRGRPPVSGEVKKPRKLSGKPLGRPKKNALTGIQASAQQPGVDYEYLKGRLEQLQSKVKQAVGVVKPHLNPESAVGALGALQELEDLATMDVNPQLNVEVAPLNVQAQEQPPLIQI